MANNGGKIAPDGRPPVAPGVGKTARRHDLEAPATPGLENSDLQQGDVSRLENSQRVAPISKRTQPSATPQAPGRQRKGAQRGSGEFSLSTPDPINMAGDKVGGSTFSSTEPLQVEVDPTPWMPLLETFASAPNTGGPITSEIVRQLSNFRRRPLSVQRKFIDMNEADDIMQGVVNSIGPKVR